MIFHDLETDLNLNDFWRAVGTLFTDDIARCGDPISPIDKTSRSKHLIVTAPPSRQRPASQVDMEPRSRHDKNWENRQTMAKM